MKESVEDNLQAYLDGYEDLDAHDKARVAKAVEEGHVADEDWKGVSVMNSKSIYAVSECLRGCGNESTGPERFSHPSLEEEGPKGGQSRGKR